MSSLELSEFDELEFGNIIDKYTLVSKINKIIENKNFTSEKKWNQLVINVLRESKSFKFNEYLFEKCFKHWNFKEYGGPKLWIPTPSTVRNSNIALFMNVFKEEYWDMYKTGNPQNDYELFHLISVSNPEAFYGQLLKFLNLNMIYEKVIWIGNNIREVRWFPGLSLNIAEIALNISHPDSFAIITSNEKSNGSMINFTLEEIKHKSYQIAYVISDRFPPKTVIVIYMPMTWISVCIYLAIILSGCIVVSVAESFRSKQIDDRINVSNAKAAFTQDIMCRGNKIHNLYEEISNTRIESIIVVSENESKLQTNLRSCDISYEDFMSQKNLSMLKILDFKPIISDGYEIINILFSSGTTGEPKAIPWNHITCLKSVFDGCLHQDIKKNDIVCWPSSLGWMMGPWLIFSTLINKATMAIFNGSPLTKEFCNFVEKSNVTILGVIPSIVKTWKQHNLTQGYDWHRIKCFTSTGEASSFNDYHWLMAQAYYKPIIEYIGGTELGGCYLTGSMLQGQSPSYFSTAAIGCKIFIIDENGILIDPQMNNFLLKGEIALMSPALGQSQKLLNNDNFEIYYEKMPKLKQCDLSHFPYNHISNIFYKSNFYHKICEFELRRHGDEIEKFLNTNFVAHGRCDDTMNLSGIKVSSVEIEKVVSSLNLVKDTAAVSIKNRFNGLEELVLFIVLKEKNINVDDVFKDIKNIIKNGLNPLFKVHKIYILNTLPRNASNKLMRRVLRNKIIGTPI